MTEKITPPHQTLTAAENSGAVQNEISTSSTPIIPETTPEIKKRGELFRQAINAGKQQKNTPLKNNTSETGRKTPKKSGMPDISSEKSSEKQPRIEIKKGGKAQTPEESKEIISKESISKEIISKQESPEQKSSAVSKKFNQKNQQAQSIEPEAFEQETNANPNPMSISNQKQSKTAEKTVQELSHMNKEIIAFEEKNQNTQNTQNTKQTFAAHNKMLPKTQQQNEALLTHKNPDKNKDDDPVKKIDETQENPDIPQEAILTSDAAAPIAAPAPDSPAAAGGAAVADYFPQASAAELTAFVEKASRNIQLSSGDGAQNAAMRFELHDDILPQTQLTAHKQPDGSLNLTFTTDHPESTNILQQVQSQLITHMKEVQNIDVGISMIDSQGRPISKQMNSQSSGQNASQDQNRQQADWETVEARIKESAK